MLAAKLGRLAAAERLLQLGARPDLMDATKSTAIMLSLREPGRGDAWSCEAVEMVRLLHRWGASLYTRDELGQTLLIQAVYYGETEVMDFILQQRAEDVIKNPYDLSEISADHRCARGYSVLDYAIVGWDHAPPSDEQVSRPINHNL